MSTCEPVLPPFTLMIGDKKQVTNKEFATYYLSMKSDVMGKLNHPC